jgi:hypothetical protein
MNILDKRWDKLRIEQIIDVFFRDKRPEVNKNKNETNQNNCRKSNPEFSEK